MKEIISIYIEPIGWIKRYSQVKRNNKQPDETTWIDIDEPIEAFTVNGEMAPVTWYRQGKAEYNGKYVVVINYSN